MKFLLALIVSMAVASWAIDVQPIEEGRIRKLWLEWNDALQTLDPEKVAELYHPESASNSLK
jgi:hypothetical protein